jgi:hypothetical protein
MMCKDYCKTTACEMTARDGDTVVADCKGCTDDSKCNKGADDWPGCKGGDCDDKETDENGCSNKVGEWNQWSACDRTCGTGIKQRSRNFPDSDPLSAKDQKIQHITDNCPRESETKTCNKIPCPDINSLNPVKEEQDEEEELILKEEFEDQKKDLRKWQIEEENRLKAIPGEEGDEEDVMNMDDEEHKAEREAEEEKEALQIMSEESNSMSDLEGDVDAVKERIKSQLRGDIDAEPHERGHVHEWSEEESRREFKRTVKYGGAGMKTNLRVRKWVHEHHHTRD